MTEHPAAVLARHLAAHAEDVCRQYLSNGRRAGHYWIVGDVHNSKGRSLYVRLDGPLSGQGAAGKWTEYVASRVILRSRDWALSCGRSTTFAQHNASTRGVA